MPNERSPKLATWNLNTCDFFAPFCSIKKLRDTNHWFKPNVRRRQKLFECWSNTTVLYDLRGWNEIYFHQSRCQERDSSHYCSLWWVWVSSPWQWAAILSCHSPKDVGQNLPFNQDHHNPFNQLNCPRHVTLCCLYTMYTWGLPLLLCIKTVPH